MPVEGTVREISGAGLVLGNHVVVDHGDGVFAAYAHLRQGSPHVADGDRMQAGQPLAEVGNSGNTTEPHLHVQLMDRAGRHRRRRRTLPLEGHRDRVRTRPIRAMGHRRAQAHRRRRLPGQRPGVRGRLRGVGMLPPSPPGGSSTRSTGSRWSTSTRRPASAATPPPSRTAAPTPCHYEITLDERWRTREVPCPHDVVGRATDAGCSCSDGAGSWTVDGQPAPAPGRARRRRPRGLGLHQHAPRPPAADLPPGDVVTASAAYVQALDLRRPHASTRPTGAATTTRFDYTSEGGFHAELTYDASGLVLDLRRHPNGRTMDGTVENRADVERDNEVRGTAHDAQLTTDMVRSRQRCRARGRAHDERDRRWR